MEKKKTSLVEMIQNGDREGFLAFRKKFAEMSKEHPLREPNEPKKNEEPLEKQSEKIVSITYHVPDDETVSIEEHIKFVLTEFNPEALMFPKRARYAAYEEVITWILQQVSPDLDSNDLFLDDAEIEIRESPTDKEQTTDTPAVQKAKKKSASAIITHPSTSPGSKCCDTFPFVYYRNRP